jgi:hypothetical protein
MKKYTTRMLVPLLLVIALTGCVTQNQHDMSWHAYGTVELPEGLPVPTLALELTEDAHSGWNLHLVTDNFAFAPERVGTEHYPGEGHAHIYIDGKMHARMYGKWFHVPQLGPGRHQILVTLNSNDHNAYTVKGQVISDTAIVTVEGSESDSDSGYPSDGGY